MAVSYPHSLLHKLGFQSAGIWSSYFACPVLNMGKHNEKTVKMLFMVYREPADYS